MKLDPNPNSTPDRLKKDTGDLPLVEPAFEENKNDLVTTVEGVQSYPKKKGQFGYLGWLSAFLLLSILGAIALPSFLYCGSKARQIEGKQFLSAINKSQQAYQQEKNTFSNNIEALDVGIKPQTPIYIYFTSATKTAAFSYAISRDQNLNSYIGAVFLVPAKDEIKTVSILCQAKSKGIARLQEPILQNGVATCGADSEDRR